MKHLKTCSALIALALLSACGGGGSPTDTDIQLHPNTPGAIPPPASTAPTPPSPAQAMLSLPGSVSNGSTLNLECGRVYHGTLNLRGRNDVTVRTAGSCGNATITPGHAIHGWTRHSGNIYSAAVSDEISQVIVDGHAQALAHWPNRAQGWARAQSSGSNTLNHAMPNADLVGARLVYKPYVWAVESRRITQYASNTISVAPWDNNMNFGGYPLGGALDFYVEGKLWMLDSPGEWAVADGRLYLWAPDGQSPEGRVWASPERDGIDAAGSRNVTIEGVDVFGAANGINGADAQQLRVFDARISNANASGILNSGGSALRVERSTIRNTRHDAIAVRWGGGNEVIRDNRIEASGSVGMPTNARAAINLTLGSGAQVLNNTVLDSGYIGIRVYRNALVSGNTIARACLVLTDCGGIYADAVDRVTLNTRIENNTIAAVGPSQRLAWGIFLGELANAVTIAGNRISDSGNGIQLLNAYDIRIENNQFMRNTQAHIQMVEYGIAPVVMHHVVSGNSFTTTGREEMFRLSSELGTSAVARFASYGSNQYISNATLFANYNGEALSFAQWRARTGQDSDSSLRAP